MESQFLGVWNISLAFINLAFGISLDDKFSMFVAGLCLGVGIMSLIK